MDAEKKKSLRNKLLIVVGLILMEIVIIIMALVMDRIYSGEKGVELLETLQSYQDKLSGFGFWSYPVMVLAQILQMLLAIIPGGPLAFLLGFMFGTVGGAVVGTIGNIIGTAMIVWAVNRFGMKFVNMFCNSKGFEKLKFLHDPHKRDLLIFVLFLIPGTPKDLITFFAPFTKAKPSRIVILATVGRLPALILSTSIGDTLAEGNIWATVILITVTMLIVGVSVFLKDMVMNRKPAASVEETEQ
ncbi:MAG: TVP38/TMEM64 family protein [Clostridia bacterium]|nr:TVP38/TMEM64 family protein [Clostridia bacterium]